MISDVMGNRGGAVVTMVVVSVVWLLAVSGCGPEDLRVSLQNVESSPGGQLATVKALEGDEGVELVAPAVDGLYVRGEEDEQWRRHGSQWPMGSETGGPGMFDTVSRAVAEPSVDPEHYFTVFDGGLWLVGVDGIGQPPRLMHSEDPGAGWQEIQPPGDPTVGRVQQKELAPLVPQMRLIAGEESLYLAEGNQLWRAAEISADMEDGRRHVDWQPVSLEGTSIADGTGQSNEEGFPLSLHHYLPATQDHSYELLTVHGRELKIYRRDDGQEHFEKMTRLEGVDRDLLRVPGEDTIYLVDAAALYRSEDRGESWEPLEVSRDSLQPEDYRRLSIRNAGGEEEEEEEAGYQLWVRGDDGGLWRSDDGGEDWEELRSRDADARAVTGLVFDEHRGRIWASTGGQGMLRSDTEGESWLQVNGGLDAASPTTASLSGPDRFVVGSNSGLYERSVLVDPDGWERIGDRATTAVHAEQSDQRLVVGTAGGGIELYVDNERVDTAEITAVGEREDVEFRPPHFQGVRFDSRSILEVLRRPGEGELIAWSHRQGPLISTDDGNNWRRMQLDDAFRSAIESAVVSHFLAMRDQTYFAVTRPHDRNQPTQVWRSEDGGATWQTTYSLREDPDETPLQLERLPDDEGLMMAHGSYLAVSTDAGETWSSVSGPWESGMITGVDVDDDQAVVVMDLPHATEIAWVEDPLDSASVNQRYRLGWPATRSPDLHRPLEVEVQGDRMVLQEGENIYRGQLPQRAAGGADSVSLVVALGAVIAMITLAFAYLRRWEA